MEKKIIEAHIGNMGEHSKESWIEFYRNSFDNSDFKFLQKSLIDYNNSWTWGILYTWFNEMGNTREFGTSSDAYTFLYYGNEMFIPVYLYEQNDGKEFEFNIGKHHYNVIGQSRLMIDNMRFSASQIIYQIFAAQILRSKDKLDFYSDIPTTELYECFDWANFGGMLKNVKILELFQQLIKGTLTLDIISATKVFIQEEMKAKAPDIDEKLFTQYIQLPLLDIYSQILQNNQKGYEEAVYQAVLLWKKRFTLHYIDTYKVKQKSENDSMGYWALPIIAACAYAYEKGMSIPNIETGYLSDWMIRGDFSQVKLMVE